jgi:hypothetical protein
MKRRAKRLRNNPVATTKQARCRFDTVGQCHLGKNVNKMVGRSLVMPSNNNATTGMKYALVGERIGGWCSILKARSNILVIALVTKY